MALDHNTVANVFAAGAADRKIVSIDFPSDLEVLTDQTNSFSYTPGNKISLSFYATRINGMLKYFDDFSMPTANHVYYCTGKKSESKNWYIYFSKEYVYHTKKDPTPKSMIVYNRMTLVWDADAEYKYRIISIDKVEGLPKDEDEDYIADDCDKCITKEYKTKDGKPLISGGGCEIASLKRDHPASRFGITLAVAPFISFPNNELTEKDISQGNLYVQPGYFNKTGIAAA